MGKNNFAPGLFQKLENAAGYFAVCALAVFPILEIFVRIAFGATIPGITELVSHLTILVTLAGCLLTTRESRHLTISAGIDRLSGPAELLFKALTSFFSLFVVTTLFWTSVSFLGIYLGASGSHQHRIAFIPELYFLVFMPASFLIIVHRFMRRTPKGFWGRTAGIGGILFGCFLSIPAVLYFLSELAVDAHPNLYLSLDALLYRIQGFQAGMMATLKLPFLILLIVSAFFGTPIFVVLGGAAFFLYAANAEPLTSVVDESYKILTSVGIPAIPLFTLTGFLLSKSRAGERFLRLFQVLLGWFPGGYGLAGILILAFFTTFTGASGVTILALGGLLSYILVQNRYGEKFSMGLITASGSVGLLFPPSLPLILFGIIAQFILKDWVQTHPASAGMLQTLKISNLFLAGLLPGLLLVLALGIMVVSRALRSGVSREAFNFRKAGAPLADAIWEILLPAFVVILFLSGLITITEVAAISALYILIVEMFVHRDIGFKDLAEILYQTLVIVGGILIILAVSKGLAQYVIIEQIPDRIVSWMQGHVHSKFVFLLLLNVALLLTGCFLDIYSAISVVAPIVIPVGLSYGVHPLHLGIIFLTNLELGYLTPPVGLNLFMSAYRFERPVGSIYRSIVPFFLVLLATLLVITYVPFISTALVNLLG